MRRVMLVDDERPIVEGLRLIITKDLPLEFEVVATASTGREALQKFEEKAPEIVLIDVMMPGLSGLDTIREIRKRSTTTVFILITAYERFDIAREAVSLHVHDYLLKPLQRDLVVRTLRNAGLQVENSLIDQKKSLEIQEQEDDSRFLHGRVFCYAVMNGEQLGSQLSRHLDALGFSTPWMTAGVVIFPKPAEDPYRSLTQLLRYKTQALAGPLVGGACLVILPLAETDKREVEVRHLENLIYQSLPGLKEAGLAVEFGLGVPWNEAYGSWNEALLKARIKPGHPQERESDPDSLFVLEDKLAEEAGRGPADGLWSQMELDCSVYISEGRVPAQGRSRWISLLSALYRRLVRQGLLSAEDGLRLMDLSDLESGISPDSWEASLRMRLRPLVDKLKTSHRYSPAVAQSLEIIRENYAKPLSLDSAAAQTGISSGRLSRLFASETGQGFSEYLIEARINQARRLLTSPGASVKQVSRDCGYPDQNYFARLFKKMTGLTPSAYARAALESENENI